jgi:cell division protein FtsB
MPPGDFAPVIAMSVFTISVALVFILRGPLGKALARRIEGPTASAAIASAEMDELRNRMEEMEQQVARVHELEERLDFTERLLAQQREQPRLPH